MSKENYHGRCPNKKTFPHSINSLLKAEGGTNSVGAHATLCGDRECRVREMQARVRFDGCPPNPLRRSCASIAQNAGESAMRRVRAQPSAEIVRVERAKRRRECDLPAARATLCGDRACRVREMQARARWGVYARNPLRRSCASSARNAGESAIESVQRDYRCGIPEGKARL